MDEKEKKEAKEALTTKIFWLGLEIIFIFGAPAFLGAALGVWLDGVYATGRKITIGILFLTFIFSWVITIVKYKKLSNQLKNLNKK